MSDIVILIILLKHLIFSISDSIERHWPFMIETTLHYIDPSSLEHDMTTAFDSINQHDAAHVFIVGQNQVLATALRMVSVIHCKMLVIVLCTEEVKVCSL